MMTYFCGPWMDKSHQAAFDLEMTSGKATAVDSGVGKLSGKELFLRQLVVEEEENPEGEKIPAVSLEISRLRAYC